MLFSVMEDASRRCRSYMIFKRSKTRALGCHEF